MAQTVSPMLMSDAPSTNPTTPSYMNDSITLTTVYNSKLDQQVPLSCANENINYAHFEERITSFVDFETGRAYIKIFNKIFFPI